jgi:UDP-glucose 4-epimerase
MRILVTGASGFIGQHIVPKLAGHKDDSVVIHDFVPFPERIANASVGGFQWDIRDAAALSSYVDIASSCESILHLAAVASPRVCTLDPATAWETNVRGTHNVLRLAQLAGIRRVVFMSSSHVYGIPPKYMPTDECHPLHMQDGYTTTKILGEDLCRLFWENHGISTCSLRLFNSYGPGQSDLYFLGATMKRALEDKRVIIKGPSITKDWIAIVDVCRAIRTALYSDYVGALNVGTGVQTSLGKIGQKVSDFFGVPYAEEATDDMGPSKMQCDPTKTESVLGWRSTVSIWEGLELLMTRARAEYERSKTV